jgi:integrase
MADYLLLRPSGYYFRYIIPRPYQYLVSVKEIRYSLGTSQQSVARRRAQRAYVFVEQLLREHHKGTMVEVNKSLLALIKEAIDTARGLEFDSHIARAKPLNPDSREDGFFINYYLLSELREAASLSDYRQFAEAPVKRLFEANNQPADIDSLEFKRACHIYLQGMISVYEDKRVLLGGGSIPAQHIISPSGKDSGDTLSDLIKKFCTEKLRSGSWQRKSQVQYEASFQQLTDIIGDKPISSVDVNDAQLWKKTIFNLPPNVSKLRTFNDLTPIQAAAQNEADGGETLTTTTFNNIHTRVNSFWKWACNNGFIERNYFDGLRVKESKRARDKRADFTDEELTKLFSTPQYSEHSFKHPYYYWVPLIGLHTGARLEEICQLHLVDIQMTNDVWCIEITDGKKDQKTKTDASNRLVPIHTTLLELGLLEYTLQLKARGEERLFPELKKGRDGYSSSVTKWFARYRDKLGMKNVKPKKDFHSFRHTLSTRLKRLNVTESVAGAIVGHTTGDGITYSLYGKDYDIMQLVEALEKLDFSSSLSQIRPYE